MSELEALGALLHPDGREQIGGAGCLVLRKLGQTSGLGEAGTVTEHRYGPDQGGCRGRPLGQAQKHGLGHGGGPDSSRALGPACVGGDPALIHLPQQRLEIERVAAGGLAARRGELGSHVGADAALAQRRRRPGAQRARPDDRGLGGGCQPGEIGRHLVAVAGGGKHRERETVQPWREVVDEAQRLGVGPMDVVDRQGNRALVGDVVHQPVEPVEHRERAIGGGKRRRIAGQREQRLRERRGAVEQPVPLLLRHPRDGGLEELPDRAVREVALELGGSRPQAREPRLPRGLHRGPQQARLA